MINWMRAMDDRPAHIPTKSTAYREGYDAYLSWCCNGGERPDNPYWTGDISGEPTSYHEWQDGWYDAGFDG